MKQKAFTLIELLVVISIISLLASIILSSLGSARAKANNSRINSQILEYVKAFHLIISENGSLPSTTLAASEQCIGTYPGNLCPADNSVNVILSKYLPSLPPAGTGKLLNSFLSIYSIATYCNYSEACAYPTLLWYLENDAQACALNATDSSEAGDGYTACNLDLSR